MDLSSTQGALCTVAYQYFLFYILLIWGSQRTPLPTGLHRCVTLLGHCSVRIDAIGRVQARRRPFSRSRRHPANTTEPGGRRHDVLLPRGGRSGRAGDGDGPDGSRWWRRGGDCGNVGTSREAGYIRRRSHVTGGTRPAHQPTKYEPRSVDTANRGGSTPKYLGLSLIHI